MSAAPATSTLSVVAAGTDGTYKSAESAASSTVSSVVATDSSSTSVPEASSTPIFITIPPSISLAPNISNITTASTTATSTVVTWTTLNQVSSGDVAYGTSTAYSATSTGNLALDHSVSLSGLTPDTTYHFGISSTDGFGTSQSIDNTFTTSVAPAPVAPEVSPPVISTISVIPTFSVATINWTTNEPASSAVYYGMTPFYSASTTEPSEFVAIPTVTHSVSIVDLTPNTTYHFAVVSENASGLSATSTDRTFTTSIEPT